MSQHKHHEVLEAILNGTYKFPYDFEFQYPGFAKWESAEGWSSALFAGEGEFRIKPVPKPDIVLQVTAYYSDRVRVDGTYADNVEFTFSPDDLTRPTAVRLLP